MFDLCINVLKAIQVSRACLVFHFLRFHQASPLHARLLILAHFATSRVSQMSRMSSLRILSRNKPIRPRFVLFSAKQYREKPER